MARRRVETVVPESPSNLQEASDWLTRFWQAWREKRKLEQARDMMIATLQSRYQNELDEINRRAAEELAPFDDEVKKISAGLAIFFTLNRADVFKRKKSVQLDSGMVKCRFTPPKVSVRGEAGVIEFLKANGLAGFVRFKETVNKEAMLEKIPVSRGVPGVKITHENQLIVSLPGGNFDEVVIHSETEEV